jgi:hypothetical protein
MQRESKLLIMQSEQKNATACQFQMNQIQTEGYLCSLNRRVSGSTTPALSLGLLSRGCVPARASLVESNDLPSGTVLAGIPCDGVEFKYVSKVAESIACGPEVDD